MKVVAVVPAFNEAQIIGAVIRGLRQFVDAVIVVDDGSLDQTAAVAAQQRAMALRHFLNRGQGAALQTGITWALRQGADIIVTFDADGQHDPNDLKQLVAPIRDGRYDVTLGSRFLRHARPSIPPARRYLLMLAAVFDRLRSGIRVTDTHNGLRAFSRSAAAAITIRQDGMAHASEILDEIARLRLRYVEVPVAISYTSYSRAKGQTWHSGRRILWDLVRQRFSR